MCPCDCNCSSVCVLTDLPHSNNSIGDEDEEDDEGLDKGSDGFLAFLKHSQNLRETEGTYERSEVLKLQGQHQDC